MDIFKLQDFIQTKNLQSFLAVHLFIIDFNWKCATMNELQIC